MRAGVVIEHGDGRDVARGDGEDGIADVRIVAGIDPPTQRRLSFQGCPQFHRVQIVQWRLRADLRWCGPDTGLLDRGGGVQEMNLLTWIESCASFHLKFPSVGDP